MKINHLQIEIDDLTLRGDPRLKIELYEASANKCPVDIRYIFDSYKNI